MSDFLVPAETVKGEVLVKKSRFIAFISYASDPTASHVFIDSIRKQYPDAGHVCWAFVAGEPGNTPHVSCSDDGEPAGTAGKPILNVLQHSDVGEIVAVVVRYFGGIKLGTGGLVRAYSGAVTELMKTLPTEIKVNKICFTLQCDYSLEDAVRRALDSYSTEILALNYQEQIQMQCQCPVNKLDELTLLLNDVGRGQIVINTDK